MKAALLHLVTQGPTGFIVAVFIAAMPPNRPQEISAAAPAGYTVIEIAPLVPGYAIEAVALNGTNRVVGNADTPNGVRGFFWQEGLGTIELRPLPGGSDSGANSSNDTGAIVGWSRTAAGATHAVYFQSADPDDLHASVAPHATQSSALDINAHGQIIGWSETDGQTRAFLYDMRYGRRTDLTTPAGKSAVPYDIDDQGRIVGTAELTDGRDSAIMWTCVASVAQTTCTAAIIPVFDGDNSGAYRIQGDAIIGSAQKRQSSWWNGGYSYMSMPTSGFKVQGTNRAAHGTLPGQAMSELRGINASGVMVGMSMDSLEFEGATAVVVTESEGARDLNVVTGYLGLGLRVAVDINDAGAIVVTGSRSSTWTAHLLKPLTAGEMVSPSQGAELAGATVNFEWNAGTASEFHLYVGSTLGGYDIYEGAQGTGLTRTVANVPTDGRNIYVRLWSKVGGRFLTRDYTYKAKTLAPAAAEITAPSNNSALSSSSVTFEWNAGVSVTDFYLYVGTTPGGYEIYHGPQGTGRSRTVSGIPTDGQPVHVTLWSRINGVFQIRRYVYTAADGRAALTLPSPGSVLSSSTEVFYWSAGTGVSGYHLYVGSSLGAFDIYDGAQGTSDARRVAGIPTDGRTIYVRLWSKIAGALRYRDYSYTAATLASAPAQMTAPSNGSTLSGASATFTWTSGVGPTEYYLYVGSAPGGYNLHNASYGLSQSAVVNGLPVDGSPVYVTLWSRIGATWQTRSYAYSASDARAAVTSPSPGSTLPGRTATLEWTAGTGVSEYHLYVGTTVGGFDIYDRAQGTARSAFVSGFPTNMKPVYVRLWSKINGAWKFRDFVFSAS